VCMCVCVCVCMYVGGGAMAVLDRYRLLLPLPLLNTLRYQIDSPCRHKRASISHVTSLFKTKHGHYRISSRPCYLTE